MSASTERKNRLAAREAGTDKKTLAAQEAAKKARKSKIRWTLGTIAVVVLVVAILFFNSGLFYRTVTAATVGGENFSASEVNYYYGTEYLSMVNQYGEYASLLGLDTSAGYAGLANTTCPMIEDGTWRDYFLGLAENDMIQVKALKDYANANGISLDAEELADVEESLGTVTQAAKDYGFPSTNRYLNNLYGHGVNTGVLRQVMLDRALAGKAYDTTLDSHEYTAEELEAEYQSYEGARDLFDYATYFVAAETEDDADDAAMTQALAEAKETANAIAIGFQERESDDYIDELNAAVDHEVPGAAASERSGVAGGSLDTAYQEWLMQSSRKAGDIVVVESSYEDGFYVVVFLGRSDNHYNTVNVRHILIQAEADEEGNYSDEAKAAAKARAEEILAQWQAGEATEESFAALAEEFSEDEGSKANGGLYENVYQGEMVTEFNDFCFDEARQPGDTAIVYGESGSYAGYHVMYFMSEGELYSSYIARNTLNSAAMSEWLDSLIADYSVTQRFGYKLVG